MERTSEGEGPGSAEGTAAGEWEVSDVDMPPTRLASEQVLGLVCGGRLGLRSQVRRTGEAAWTPAMQRPEFGYGFPHLNAVNVDRKAQEIAGIAALNPNLACVLDFAREAASDPAAGKLDFWFAAHVAWATTPLFRRTHLFQMWDGFYVAPIIESVVVKPGGWLNVYMAAFNLTDKEQQHSIHPADTAVTPDMERNLTFALGPWKWTVQRVSIPAKPKPGGHQVGFRSKSTAARGATAAAVGVLTLGTFIYAPGYKGFTLQYQVLQPEVAKTVVAWEGYAVGAAARHFSERGTDAITAPRGYKVPKDAALQRFGMYLTAGRVLAGLEDKERKPEENMGRLFDAFLLDAFGVEGVEKAFPKAGVGPTEVGPSGPP